jgi:hypothetical protein
MCKLNYTKRQSISQFLGTKLPGNNGLSKTFYSLVKSHLNRGYFFNKKSFIFPLEINPVLIFSLKSLSSRKDSKVVELQDKPAVCNSAFTVWPSWYNTQISVLYYLRLKLLVHNFF